MPAAAPAIATATATATATKAPPRALAQATRAASGRERSFSRGYKLEMRGSDEHFCRNETPLGTRFIKTICVTPQEVAATDANAHHATRQSQRVGFDYAKGGIAPSGKP